MFGSEMVQRAGSVGRSKSLGPHLRVQGPLPMEYAAPRGQAGWDWVSSELARPCCRLSARFPCKATLGAQGGEGWPQK